MKRTWTIIGVRDVADSFKWYQSLFGQSPTRPAHPDFGQIVDSDGTVLLCLHQWGVEDHSSLMSPDEGKAGNGLLLFFRVDDFDMALQRGRALVARLEEDPHVNPNTRTREFSLRDPDGYYVTIRALEGRTRRPTRPRAASLVRHSEARGQPRRVSATLATLKHHGKIGTVGICYHRSTRGIWYHYETPTTLQ